MAPVTTCHDHGARHPQGGAHDAHRLLGRLVGRRRRLPRSLRHRPDQTGRAARTCRRSRDGLDGMVGPGPLEPGLAADRARPITGHRLGPVPALLGPGEAADQPLRRCRPAPVRAEPRLRLVHAKRRSARPRGCRAAAAARGHDAVRVQAAWAHALWLAKAGRAASAGFAKTGQGSGRVSVLQVPGARLHYETRGSGPLMVMVPGANGEAGAFEAVAEHLAAHYTVVTYDRRGFSRSRLEGPQDY